MLTNAELLRLAPAAAATTPALHCSAQYTMVPTMSMVEVLRGEGYVPVAAKQMHATPDRWGNELHKQHMITLRQAGTEHMSRGAMLAGLVPELLLVNSSDGSHPFQLRQGILRMVCSNGLIVMQETEKLQLVHKRISADDVIARAKALSANTKPLFDKIARWGKIRLNPLAQKRFAEQALALRIGEQRAKAYDTTTVLAVRRPDDEEPTLWNVFNRTQEACMQGHVRSLPHAPHKAALGRINAIGAELAFNEQLWALTERWAGLVK